MAPFAVSLLLALTLLPLPTPARPVPPPGLVARQSPSTRMDADLIFNIIFSLALLFVLLGRFAWLATGRTIAQLVESFNRMHAAIAERLSDFRFSSLIERAAGTILDSADANTTTTNTPRRGGASYPIATVPWGRLQSGVLGRFGTTRGDGDPPAFTPST